MSLAWVLISIVMLFLLLTILVHPWWSIFWYLRSILVYAKEVILNKGGIFLFHNIVPKSMLSCLDLSE